LRTFLKVWINKDLNKVLEMRIQILNSFAGM
jgi:hypothetical protein